MHPYYEQAQDKLKKDMNSYFSCIHTELEEALHKPYDKILEDVWACYKADMLEYFPYIGGDKASGTRNLTGAYMFVALGVVCQKQDISIDDWGHMATIAYQRYFEKIPKWLLKLAGKLMQKPKLMTPLLKKKDAKNKANNDENPGSFLTKTQPSTEEYPLRYDTIQCPLALFAKEHGYMEYMPYICNLDYVMFACANVPFYREHTCADGDGYCDFKLKKGAPIAATWPCHAADPKDPLK